MQSITRRLMRVVAVACALSGGVTAAAYADNHVALGGSYSSGTGTRDYSLNSGCQRGPYAYPALIKADRPGTNLTFVACSGARPVTCSPTRCRRSTRPPTSVIPACAAPLVRCHSNITNAQNYINNSLPGALNGVYSQIRSRAPSARVVVLGYPRIVMGVDCNAGTFFSTDEMTKLNATADMMRNVISGRAAA